MAEFDDAQSEGIPDWIRDPAGVFRRRWQALLATFVVGLVATGVVAFLREPLYVANAGVLLADQKLAEALVKPSTDASPIQAIDALAAEALSTANLRKVVDELKLYPDLRESSSPDELVALLRASIQVDPREPGEPKLPPQMRLAERSRVMRITFESPDPVEAAKVANRLAMLFQTEGLRMRGEQVRLVSEFMRREVASTETALREQKARAAAFEEAHRGELPSDLEANKRRIERLHDQRAEHATSAAEAETRLASLLAAPTSGETSAEAKLGEARSELAAALSVNTETHPNVIALRRQVTALEQERQSSASGGSVAAAARREIEQYRKRIADADDEIERLEARIGRTPSHEAELSGIEQRATSLGENYSSSLEKLREAELAESLELSQQGAQVVVVEEALPPTEAEKGRTKLVLGGLVASLGLAVLAALLLELRDPVIATAQGVESLSGVPVLGVMPRVS